MQGDPALRDLFRGPLDELRAYLSGEFEALMGIKSWLGPMCEWGPAGAPTGSAVQVEPSQGALWVAQAMARVERAGKMIARAEARVLVERYRPHGPYAPWGLIEYYGPIAHVIVALEDPGPLRALLQLSKRQRGAEGYRQLGSARARAELALERAETAFCAAHRAARAEQVAEHRRRPSRAERLRRTLS